MLSVAPSTGVISEFDSLFLDLDGVVYRSGEAVPKAVDALNLATDRGAQIRFLTNNASRTPAQVAEQLVALGLHADVDMVVTSAQAVAQLLASHFPSGSSIFTVGDVGLENALRESGLYPTRSADADPVAVVQGHSPHTNWGELAQAGYLIESGIPWYACNEDLSIPTAQGLAPGNGAFVALLATLTDETPLVAGKPEPALFNTAAATVRGTILMIGDRLDTDIEGGKRAGIPSAWVNTGVHSFSDVMTAPARQRPDFILNDLAGLFRPQHHVQVSDDVARCGNAVARVVDGVVCVEQSSDIPEDELRAIVALAWHIRDVADTNQAHGERIET